MPNLIPSTLKQRLIVKKAYQAFFSPGKREEAAAEREIIQRGKTYRLPYSGGQLAVSTWGEVGPAILLMHGWGGALAQMTGFVMPLLTAGYRVVAYDQPAHGQSDGLMTNVLEIAPTMELVTQAEGPFETIIAHSFGTLVVSYGLANLDYPAPQKLVYLGSFNRLMDSLPRFQVLAGLPDVIMDGVRDKIYDKFNRDVLEAITNESMTQRIDIPALLFHDTTDEVTPIEDSRSIAKVWKSANLIETDGLGHRGGLQSSDIHAQIVKFLKGDLVIAKER